MKKYIILTILVLTLVLTGCVQKKIINQVDNTENNELSKENSMAILEDEDIDVSSKDIEDWQSYEKEDKNMRLKYHKDWYYKRDEQAEKELGYDLYVGFAASEEILENGRPYPVEFLIVAEDKNIHDAEYAETVVSMNNKNYILITNNKSEYGEILEKMIGSLEVIIN